MKKFMSGLLSLSLIAGISSSALAEEKAPVTTDNITASSIFYEYEPNNDYANANPFVIGNQINADFINSSSDYYVFTPTETKTYTFSIAHNSNQSYSITLADETNKNLIRTSYDMSQKSFTYTVQANKKYYLRLMYIIGENYPSYSQSYTVYTTPVN